MKGKHAFPDTNSLVGVMWPKSTKRTAHPGQLHFSHTSTEEAPPCRCPTTTPAE